MLMHGMELHTAAREEVPIVIAVMNNRAYGNIWYRAHTLGPGPEHLTEITGVDWVGFARSMGGDGEAVEHPDQIAGAVRRGLAFASALPPRPARRQDLPDTGRRLARPPVRVGGP